MELIAFAYDADIHCLDCTEKRFPGVATSSGFLAGNYADSEGNEPSAIFEDEESDTPQHCADCGVFLGGALTSDGYMYVVAALRDVADGSPDVLREWFERYADGFESEDYEEIMRAWVPLMLPEGLREITTGDHSAIFVFDRPTQRDDFIRGRNHTYRKDA